MSGDAETLAEIAARAESWDEGYEAGWSDGTRPVTPEDHRDTPNPYRAAQPTEGES